MRTDPDCGNEMIGTVIPDPIRYPAGLPYPTFTGDKIEHLSSVWPAAPHNKCLSELDLLSLNMDLHIASSIQNISLFRLLSCSHSEHLNQVLCQWERRRSEGRGQTAWGESIFILHKPIAFRGYGSANEFVAFLSDMALGIIPKKLKPLFSRGLISTILFLHTKSSGLSTDGSGFFHASKPGPVLISTRAPGDKGPMLLKFKTIRMVGS